VWSVSNQLVLDDKGREYMNIMAADEEVVMIFYIGRWPGTVQPRQKRLVLVIFCTQCAVIGPEDDDQGS